MKQVCIFTNAVVVFSQVDKIEANVSSQLWSGLQVVSDLPGRGRGVKTTRAFEADEVICDYGGKLLDHKTG